MKTIRKWWASTEELARHLETILDPQRKDADWTTEEMERTAREMASAIDKCFARRREKRETL